MRHSPHTTSGPFGGPNPFRVATRGTMEATYRSDPRPQTHKHTYADASRIRTLRARDPQPCARAEPYRPGADPQFLHHRAHRPRQVHARRPDAPADRSGRAAADARSVPRPHGHRARARHHDQVPGGAVAVGPDPRQERHAHPQHDRHPGARRLHLRGLPLARRLRGHDPAGRRRPGHRGPDPRQPLPGDGERPHDHPGAQQDRPAGRAAGEVRRGAGEPGRLRPRRRPQGVREDRSGRRGAAGQGGRRDPRPGRRQGRPRPRDDLRLGLRLLPRCRDVRPCHRRPAQQARADPDDVHRRDPRAAGDRHQLPGDAARRRPRRRRGGLPDHRCEGRPPVEGR